MGSIGDCSAVWYDEAVEGPGDDEENWIVRSGWGGELGPELIEECKVCAKVSVT